MNTILNGIAFSHAFVCAGVVAVSVMIPAGRGQAEPAAAQGLGLGSMQTLGAEPERNPS